MTKSKTVRRRSVLPAPSAQTISELVADPANRRTHTPRNIDMIAASLRDVGASRSIVIDEANEVLAGNGVLEGAHQAGLTKLQIIDADGDTIIAVRRRGLTPEQKRALAIYDNRTAELAEWNADQLRIDASTGLPLQPFFFDDELAALLKKGASPDGFKSVDENVATDHTCPKCGYEWSGGKK